MHADAIRRSPSLAVFKRSLKTHFYIQCFNIVFITFSLRAVDIVKFPLSIFFIYDILILTILHLHYIYIQDV